MEDITGKQLGPYHIVAPLGEGGMAAIYKAYQPAVERYVALKVLPRSFAEDPQFVERFRREAKLLAQLQHPHILPVFDYGQADGYTYIVMPLIQSGTLGDLLKGQPLPLPRIRQVISQIADALNYAHAHGMIHRDVKPSNVLMDESGNCLLSDFGLARMVEASLNLTSSGSILGTPNYMSPEQGSGQKIDSRSDIYSLGVILYEMATGRVPYKAETPIAVVFKHLRDPLPPARSFNPELPEAVEAVILKALSKNPEDRYQTAGEMKNAIQTAIPDKPLVATAAPAPTLKLPVEARRDQPRVSIPRKRIPVWVWATIGGLLLLAIGGGLLNAFGSFLTNKAAIQITNTSPAVLALGPTPTPTLIPPPTLLPQPTPDAPVKAGLSKGGKIKIAILAPLTGPVPSFGISSRDGAIMAFDEWNSKTSELGFQVEWVVEDSKCDGEAGVNAARKVIDQDGVKFIIGEACSRASIPISDIAEARGVVQISPASTHVGVTLKSDGTTKAYVFRACFVDPFQGLVGASFALKKLNAKTAFIMLDPDNEYVRGLAETFEKAFINGGGKVVGKKLYSAANPDFSSILALISETKPDVVYLPDYYNIVNQVMAQAKKNGITATFMGGDGWDSPGLDRKAADGGYFTNHYSMQDPRPIVKDWVTRFGRRYKDDQGNPKMPDALAALSYDAANLMLEAIREAGSADPARVKDALSKIKWEGITGVISFDPQHNPFKPAVIMQVKDGKIAYIGTMSP